MYSPRAILSLSVGDSPPGEFRIFRAGENDTTKGLIVFDAEAATAVMSEYAKHGVQIMIDLEHLSLDQESRAFDPDARGWADLEVRNGELWAVNVKWTSDGAKRLAEKRQRFVSPVVAIDPDTRRAQSILNVAITALPATHEAAALVAASMVVNLGDHPMKSADVKAALEAVKAGDADAALAILEAMLLEMAAGDAPADEPAAEETPMAEGAPAPEDEEKQAEQAAMAVTARAVLGLSGREDFGAAVEDVKLWRAAYLELAAERAKNAKDRATLEATERHSLVATLVKLGVEIPATAWADLSAKRPCKRLADEPIADLRDRVAKLSKARGGQAPAAPRAPAQAPADAGGKVINGVQLSARELAICAEQKCEPADYARNKAIHLAARKGKN